MNIVKNIKIVESFLKSKTIKSKEVKNKREIHRKILPPLVNKSKVKEVYDVKESKGPPVKPEKAPRDIYGATILPQNLSFENAKKLSENIIKLSDIPLVDENQAAEELAAEKLRAKRKKKIKTEEQNDVIIIDENQLENPKELKKSVDNMFWVADPYEDIPGPQILRNLSKTIKEGMRQLTLLVLSRFVKADVMPTYKTYGPIVKLPEFLGGKLVLMSRPEHMSAVFEQDQRIPINFTFDSVQKCRLLGRNRDNFYAAEEWEEVKKELSKPEIKSIDEYFDGIDEIASKFVRRIKTIKNRQDEVPEDFFFEINKWSLESLFRVIFDKSLGFFDDCSSWSTKKSQLLFSLTVATKNLCKLETGFQFWRFLNTPSLSSLAMSYDTLESIVGEYVGQVQVALIKQKKKNEPGKVSYLESLLLQEETPEEVVAKVVDMLLIGVNTTSSALGFLLYHITSNQGAQQQLYKEARAVLPEKYSRLEVDQLPSLKYISACLYETLRLKMPMPVLTRLLSNNVVVGNYQIPKGTFVIMTPQVESLKPTIFEEPTKFVPERWLNQYRNYPFAKLPIRNYFENDFERRIAEVSILVCAMHIFRHFLVDYQYEEIEATSTVISFPNKPLRFTFAARKD